MTRRALRLVWPLTVLLIAMIAGLVYVAAHWSSITLEVSVLCTVLGAVGSPRLHRVRRC
jgi:hypothetical protein